MNEAAFRKLISGQSRGLGPTLLRGGLSGLSRLYGCGVALRNRAFDTGVRRVHKVAVPVVSVGNLTTGGTGKTPFVAWLAHWFREHGLQPVILSRGYRACKAATSGRAGGRDHWSRLSNEADMPLPANDEKLVLDQLCPGVPHLQNPDRVAAAQQAVRECGAQLLILDDGFQHRRLHRDLDIVLIDALNPFGYGRLLPRGLLREPIASLKRANLVVLTRADQCPPDDKQRILNQIAGFRGEQPVIEVRFAPVGLLNANGTTTKFESLNGRPVLAFCGIGNPEGFQKTLQQTELSVAEFVTFPDHHPYTADDLASLETRATRHHAAAVLTTQKDLVKLDRLQLADRPLWAVQIGTELLHGRELLEQRFQNVLETI